ncbi:hypothetical protein Tco_1377086, partial [Tanacetum coccineum]
RASDMSTLFQCSGVPGRSSGMSTLFQCSGVPDRASGMSTLFQCSGVPGRASGMSTLFQCSGVPDRESGMSTLFQCSGVLDRASAVMSSASSAVTYTSVYTNFEQWGFYEGSNEESAYAGSPGVIVYGYDGLLMHPVAPPSPDYVPGPEHPPSPDYVPDPEHPPLTVYVPEPDPILKLYVADSDPEEDPKVDHADYPANGRDGDDEPSDDDNDDDVDDEDEEASEDEEEDEHLALADSSTVLVVDPVPSAGDTKAFETDESAPTPRSPQIIIPPSLTRLCRARKTIPSPPLPISSPLLPLPSSFTTSPTDARHHWAIGRLGFGLDLLATPAHGFEVGESLATGATRQPWPTLGADFRRDMVREMGYGITDT